MGSVVTCTTVLPQWLLKDFKREIFEHPPYSLDQASSNFHAFPQLKTELGWGVQHFANEKSLWAAVNTFFKKMSSLRKKLVSHYNKCLHSFDLNGFSYF